MAGYLNKRRCTLLSDKAAFLDFGVDFEDTFLVDLIQLDPLDVP